MDRQKAFDGFEFNQYSVGNDEVGAETALQTKTFETNGDFNLAA